MLPVDEGHICREGQVLEMLLHLIVGCDALYRCIWSVCEDARQPDWKAVNAWQAASPPSSELSLSTAHCSSQQCSVSSQCFIAYESSSVSSWFEWSAVQVIGSDRALSEEDWHSSSSSTASPPSACRGGTAGPAALLPVRRQAAATGRVNERTFHGH